MKKFVALLLALALMATRVLSAMADYDMIKSMKKWVDVDLDGYEIKVLFNYNESVALNAYGKSAPVETTQAFNPKVAKASTVGEGKSGTKEPTADTRYVISGTYVAGFEVGKEIIGNGSTLNVVPVDIADCEVNTVYVYPVVTNSHVVIGLLFAKVNVDEGFVQIELQYKDELYKDYGTELCVYTTKAQLADGFEANYGLDEAISIEEELGGAPAILVAIQGKVTYPTLFGPRMSKIVKKNEDGTETVTYVTGKTYAYQDYFRYESWVKSYRTNMTAALALVAE